MGEPDDENGLEQDEGELHGHAALNLSVGIGKVAQPSTEPAGEDVGDLWVELGRSGSKGSVRDRPIVCCFDYRPRDGGMEGGKESGRVFYVPRRARRSVRPWSHRRRTRRESRRRSC